MVHDLFGLDLNVHRLPAGTSKGLVDHNAAVGHAVTLALLACAVGESPTQQLTQQQMATTAGTAEHLWCGTCGLLEVGITVRNTCSRVEQKQTVAWAGWQ